MEELLKLFFAGLTNAIATGIKQGYAQSAQPVDTTPDAAGDPPADDAPAEDKPAKRKRRTKKEIAADKAAAEAAAEKEAADDDDALDDDDDPSEPAMSYEDFMDQIRNVLRAAAKKGEGEGAKAKKKALAWLKKSKDVDQFVDLDPTDFPEVLEGITNVVA